MPFGILKEKTPKIFRHFNYVKIIASGIAAGFIKKGQLHVVNFWDLSRQKPVLNLGDHFKLMLKPFFLALNLTFKAVNGKMGVYPCLYLIRLKRL